MNQKKIGLLGGTFNPIHNGHLHIADAVFKRLHLDEILFIPSGKPPHRESEGLLSARYRLEMVRLALLKRPSFSLCDLEVRRSGPSYSIDTIRMLKQQHPTAHFFFIIGMDAFLSFLPGKRPVD
ncbi:MAG: nicotinate (nicotinamide) nucleotide adenylyltransferase [Nitrospiria bacterium]